MKQIPIPKRPARNIRDWIDGFCWKTEGKEWPCRNCFATGEHIDVRTTIKYPCPDCGGTGKSHKDYWVTEYKRMIRDWKDKVKEIKYKNRVLKSIDRKLSNHEIQVLDKLINVCWDGDR